MKKTILIISTVLLLFTYGTGQAQDDANSMNDLLLQIEQGQARDSEEARQREARFAAARNQQQKLLNDLFPSTKVPFIMNEGVVFIPNSFLASINPLRIFSSISFFLHKLLKSHHVFLTPQHQKL